MPRYVPQIRVFVASPGDVNEERLVIHKVLDMLEYDLLFQKDGKTGVSIHAIAWDKPGADTAMRATKTPQTAIREGLPRPSECDIVLVLFWGRMGTPLPQPEYQKADGTPYLSGTEWEFLDAFDAEIEHGKPITLIYRRIEAPKIDINNRDQFEQYHAVLKFFERFKDPNTGSLLGGYNEYNNPENLSLKLVTQLRNIIYEILHQEANTLGIARRPIVEAPPTWEGSPFPGLRAFREEDAPIFFGRGLEASELVKRVEANRFVAIVAASGSGKSSLVGAGLIPRLRANAVVNEDTGSKDWRYLSFTPGKAEHPFAGLFSALIVAFPESKPSPFRIAKDKQDFIEILAKNPQSFIDTLDALLREAKAPTWTEVFIFIDQFEELFTLVSEEHQKEFIAWLEVVSKFSRLRLIVTMRSDFYAKCLEQPILALLMKEATYPLSIPSKNVLLEMVKRPAERAALEFDGGLPEKILDDTGSDAGALALLAYTLDELYKIAEKRGDRRISFADYVTLGGVQGAIGKRAEQSFQALAGAEEIKSTLLAQVFRELVEIDERGVATRQRFPVNNFNQYQLTLVHAFTQARLLVMDEELVEVADEALFRSWDRLRNWISEASKDLILIRQIEREATEWVKAGRRYELTLERINQALNSYDQQSKIPSLDAQELLYPQQRWLNELESIQTSEQRRQEIGDALARIGDQREGVGIKSGIPDINWLFVNEGGHIDIKEANFIIRPFYVAKYLITFVQYQAFVDAEDGYKNLEWWDQFPKDQEFKELKGQRTKSSNNPRDSISWYQAMAFAKWLNARLHGLELPYAPTESSSLIVGQNAEIRLPRECEWQWVAQNGAEKREYPWGGEWQRGFSNTSESGLERAIAVGSYPHGAAACGALDLAGNLYEWCLDNREYQEDNGSLQKSILCGGSFGYSNVYARLVNNKYDVDDVPHHRNEDYGFRVVLCKIDSA